MNEPAQFFRVSLGAIRLGDADKVAWLIQRSGPLAITFDHAKANVYPEQTARAILENLLSSGLFPDAVREPATFEEWIAADPSCVTPKPAVAPTPPKFCECWLCDNTMPDGSCRKCGRMPSPERLKG